MYVGTTLKKVSKVEIEIIKIKYKDVYLKKCCTKCIVLYTKYIS